MSTGDQSVSSAPAQVTNARQYLFLKNVVTAVSVSDGVAHLRLCMCCGFLKLAQLTRGCYVENPTEGMTHGLRRKIGSVRRSSEHHLSFLAVSIDALLAHHQQ